MQRIFLILALGILLAGCPATKDMNESGGGSDITSDSGTGGGDTIVIVQQNNSGMSDPSKCNNLPPGAMADCLEQSMGN